MHMTAAGPRFLRLPLSPSSPASPRSASPLCRSWHLLPLPLRAEAHTAKFMSALKQTMRDAAGACEILGGRRGLAGLGDFPCGIQWESGVHHVHACG